MLFGRTFPQPNVSDPNNDVVALSNEIHEPSRSVWRSCPGRNRFIIVSLYCWQVQVYHIKCSEICCKEKDRQENM